jgi:hypothetical protein
VYGYVGFWLYVGSLGANQNYVYVNDTGGTQMHFVLNTDGTIHVGRASVGGVSLGDTVFALQIGNTYYLEYGWKLSERR